MEGPQENRDRSSTGGGREGDGQEAGVLRENQRGQNTIFWSFIKALEYFQKKGTPKCYLDYINNLLGFPSQNQMKMHTWD